MSEKDPFERKLDWCLNQGRIPFSKSKEAAWIEVERSIENTKIIPLTTSTKPTFVRMMAAASILAVGLIASMYALNFESLETTSATAEMQLPDGSTVVLNKNSAAEFNALSWYISREVDLSEGEAFFEVEKGSEFTVNTPMGKVAVLGTSFDVSLENNTFSVACKTGKVWVENGLDISHSSVVLEPGMKVTMTAQTSELDQIDINNIDSWNTGLFSFDNVMIDEVFKVLSSNSGYDIDFPKSLSEKYSGQFSIEQPLTEILITICKPLKLDFKVNEQNKTILITKL